MKDVDDTEVERFRGLAAKRGRIAPELLDEPEEVLMQKLHLVNSGYLTNAATLLFAKDPQDFQQGAYIKIGYFASNADLLYQDEIHCSLLEQVDKALEVIYLKYMKAKISYEGIQRVERYFVPEAALREALLNAVCQSSTNPVFLCKSAYTRIGCMERMSAFFRKHGHCTIYSASMSPDRVIPIWRRYYITLDVLKAGAEELRKSARHAERTGCLSRNLPCIPGTS